MKIPIPFIQLTPRQNEYILALCIDLQLSRTARNVLLTEKCGRAIQFLDELSLSEASKVIEYFKELKEQRLP